MSSLRVPLFAFFCCCLLVWDQLASRPNKTRNAVSSPVSHSRCTGGSMGGAPSVIHPSSPHPPIIQGMESMLLLLLMLASNLHKFTCPGDANRPIRSTLSPRRQLSVGCHGWHFSCSHPQPGMVHSLLWACPRHLGSIHTPPLHPLIRQPPWKSVRIQLAIPA
jgi:hypothetical protein